MKTRPAAVVTGGNRGLGLETCRQLAGGNFRVVLTARRQETAHEAAEQVGAEPMQLDVTDAESIARAAAAVSERFGHLDVLVNNAAVLMSAFNAKVAKRTIEVNVLGAMAVTDAFRPILSAPASIVMVSSSLGELSCLSPARRRQFEEAHLSRERLVVLMQEFIRDVEDGTEQTKGWPRSAYNVSKVGLNALTRVLARELGQTGIRVNAVCPGWVRTDMGGGGAPRTVEEGARGIVWASTLPQDGPTGGFFRDGIAIPW